MDDGRAAEQLLFRSRPGDDGNRDPVQAERGDGGQRKAKGAVGAQVGLDRTEGGLAHDLQSLSRAAGAGHGAFVHQPIVLHLHPGLERGAEGRHR